MKPLRILFIGGTGIISTACVAAALARGDEVHLLNRGTPGGRPVPEGAIVHTGDVRDEQSVLRAIDGLHFDVVVQFLGFVPEHIEQDLRVFTGRCDQYIFISSASAYQTPPTHLPVTESTPLSNPYWEYSRNKIACEDALVSAYRQTGFPVTIVRPSHTYDPTMVPFDGGWTVVDRMRRGKGVVVPGDGTSLWTITHHTDFARGFVGLFGRVGSARRGVPHHRRRVAHVELHLSHDRSGCRCDGPRPRACALGRRRRGRRGVGLGSARGQGELDGLRQQQDRGACPGVPRTGAFLPRRAGILDWYEAHPEAQVVDPHSTRSWISS